MAACQEIPALKKIGGKLSLPPGGENGVPPQQPGGEQGQKPGPYWGRFNDSGQRPRPFAHGQLHTVLPCLILSHQMIPWAQLVTASAIYA